jgi:hypothetical protein
MNRRKSVVALAVLCALAISAVSVASASATSAFTCVNTGTAFRGAHCLTTGTASQTWSHTAITSNPTTITGTNANTATETTTAAVSILKGKLAGLETELQCTEVAQAAGTNTLENTEGKVKGTGAITYSKCTVLKPAGKSCLVGNEKMVTTEKLKAETLSATELKFAPNTGTTFANIVIEGCTVAALNNTFPVTGSLIGTVSGATTTTTHAGVTAQGTVFFGGNPAGLDGGLTTKGPSGAGITDT